MPKFFVVGLLLSCQVFLLTAQQNILHREDIISEVKKGLAATYNYNFEGARESLEIIRKKAPYHPATPFLESLIIYWENYPMTFDNKNTGQFLSLVEKSFGQAEKMLQSDPENMEGIFFDLFGKAFYVMYWADIGRPTRAISYLNLLYRQTVKGFELQGKFNEFSFTTGLYNYYIVAYPEKHPAYRAIALLFRRGDKEYGLARLNYAAENAIFLRVEANFYLASIYLKFENDINKALEYASRLYREFPNNYLFASLYAELLMLDKKFPIADVIIGKLEHSENRFASLSATLLRAYYLEKYEGNYFRAHQYYQTALRLSAEFGELTKYETARAHMGISRYQRRNNQSSEASRSYRAARSNTGYEHVLNDR